VSAQERLGFFVAMGGQVVEDDGGTGFDLGYQHVTDVSDKSWAVYYRQCIWQSQMSREALLP